ncbi:MAG: NFACT family protein [Treponema sp.]|jgi:predicted ribosome quality control (RQC) complex YloA/Tae2 family protein|nr:NFACT family protein [Treponema sp.]
MSLNWKEIDLVLSELELEGCQIQKVLQSDFDVIALRVYGRGRGKTVLISLSPGACRIHETFRAFPKSDKPLRFAEFLNSRITNGRIEEAVQLGDNRIARLRVRQGKNLYRLYIRLWSNAANVIVTGEDGIILDAMRRLPRRGEQTGGRYAPEETMAETAPGVRREYRIRDFPPEPPEGGGDRPSNEGERSPNDRGRSLNDRERSFNGKLDDFYAEQGGNLSLESLREQVRRNWEGKIGRLSASLEKLRAKRADFASAEQLKQYGDIILANLDRIAPGERWLEAENFYNGERVRIRLEEGDGPAQAERYYEQYRKAKRGLEDLGREIGNGEAELAKLEGIMNALLSETNPLALRKIIKTGGVKAAPTLSKDRKRPGLSFRRNDWLIIVGRDAAENDALLRRHVKGNDLWLHARDYPGSYVFIKQRSGKTVPLEILLDAGNLAIFYSKGRGNGEGDLFYTPVKYLRRAKDGPKGLVLPTQEKNLHVKVDAERLRELEYCRVEKAQGPPPG